MKEQDALTSLGQRIRARRQALGMSQQQLAEASGYRSRSSINKIELGLTQTGAAKLEAIAGALNTTASALLRPEALPAQVEPLPAMTQVPLVGTIACGQPILAQEHIEELVAMPSQIHADFALRCRGDSMIGAGIHDGDLVYIIQQDQVENGEIAAVLIGEEATLKRVMKYPNSLVLMAENPRYAPLIYTEQEHLDIRILGRAVAYTARVR